MGHLLVIVVLAWGSGYAVEPPLGLAPSGPVVADLLTWDAPNACPSKASVVSRVLGLTGGATPPEDLQFEFRIRRTGEVGFLMQRISTDGTDARRFESRDCDELGDAAAVMIALAIGLDSRDVTGPVVPLGSASDSRRVRESGSQSGSPPGSQSGSRLGSRSDTQTDSQPDSQPPPEIKRVGEQTGAQLGPRLRRVRARVFPQVAASVATFGVWQVIPGVWPAAIVGVGLRGSGFALDGRISLLPWARAYADEARAYGGTLTQLLVDLRACVVLFGSLVELPLCAGAAGGIVRARGVGRLKRPETAVSPWVGVAAGPELRLPLRSVVFTASVDALAMPRRPNFVVQGGGAVCCASRWGLRFGLGAEFRWTRSRRR
ncbi:MAG: hypothetical protein V3V08_26150 [Nannocystaceae bacterium]